MRKAWKTSVAVVALSCVTANAWAAGAVCAKPQETHALQAAAVQQRLMVAALSCDAVAAYNRFVLAYQKELQSSDRALQSFFRRLNARTGTADYHAYKTRLANASSIQSIGNITEYCASAKQIFSSALETGKATLAAFLSSQTASNDYPACVTQMAGENAQPPANVPIPREKPLDTVLPAQGGN